jgi:hypothetical protein
MLDHMGSLFSGVHFAGLYIACLEYVGRWLRAKLEWIGNESGADGSMQGEFCTNWINHGGSAFCYRGQGTKELI